jgi:hypothetical protein
MMMKAIHCSQSSVLTRVTLPVIPEDGLLQSHLFPRSIMAEPNFSSFCSLHGVVLNAMQRKRCEIFNSELLFSNRLEVKGVGEYKVSLE